MGLLAHGGMFGGGLMGGGLMGGGFINGTPTPFMNKPMMPLPNLFCILPMV
jgi:hypothetical protein